MSEKKEQTLKENSVSMLGVVIMSVCAAGPAMCLGGSFGTIMQGAGSAVALAFLIATIVMLVVEFGGMRLFVRVLAVPKYILLPAVLIRCIVGTYGTNHNMFDVWTSLLFGVIGYFMMRHKFPQAPMILGFVLGTVVEENLIRGLMYTDNNFFAFFKSPIAAVFMLAAIAMVIWTGYKQVKGYLQKKTA